MANWLRTIDVREPFKAARDGRASIQDLAKEVSVWLANMPPIGREEIDERREELSEEFLDLAQTKEASAEDFDALWEALYDWGDTPLDSKWNGKKVCWIAAAF